MDNFPVPLPMRRVLDDTAANIFAVGALLVEKSRKRPQIRRRFSGLRGTNLCVLCGCKQGQKAEKTGFKQDQKSHMLGNKRLIGCVL